MGRTTWAVAGQAATVAFTLAGTRAITQFLDPGLYGTVNLVQNGVLLLRNLLCAPIFSAAVRFFPDAERGGFLPSFKQTLVRSLALALIALELIVVVAGLVAMWRIGLPLLVVVITAVYAAADVLRTLDMTLLGAAQRQRPVAILTALETLLRPILIVGCVILFGASLPTVLGAIAASVVLTVAVIQLLLDRGDRPAQTPVPAEVLVEMKRFAVPLIPVAFLSWTTSLSDRYIIEWLTHDTAGIGVYASGYGLTSAPLMIINGVVLMVLRPVYFNAVSANDFVKARKTFLGWVTLTGTLCLLAAGAIYVLRQFIVDTFLGPQYRQAVVLIPWIALGYVFCAIEQVLEQKMMAHKRSMSVLIAQCAGALASVGVTIPLVLRFGMPGAAYACPIYFLIQCAVAAMLLGDTRAGSGPAGSAEPA